MNPFATSKLLISTIQASARTVARQLRNEPSSEVVKKTHPIVLMHGLAGFREISIGGIKLFDYFNGVGIVLNNMGYATYAPRVPFFARPQDRASAWFHEIEKIRRETGAEKVHLVGHSQGGLDARVLIAENKPAQDTPLGPLMGLGYGDRVASVVTFGTPHLGSVMVDVLNDGDPKNLKLVNELLEFISVITRVFSGDLQDARGAIQSLGRRYILDYFNPIIEDNPAVPCYTVAGDPETAKLTTPLFKSSYQELLKIPEADGGGRNDGLVTLHSAFFGCPPPDTDMEFTFAAKEHPRAHWQPLGVIQADHIEMIGIPSRFSGADVYDHIAAFAGLVLFLDREFDTKMTLEKNGEWTRHTERDARPPTLRTRKATVKARKPVRKSAGRIKTQKKTQAA